ncbi:MAG: 23S rRNA (adenine(2503)-C(2))-methyltransferase RlmN [Armatimonadetes bacterium]|nr:23S rRNA (adenine(2503)-C(2))-methyltransferase RlmN [Armatimonadota bacterium]
MVSDQDRIDLLGLLPTELELVLRSLEEPPYRARQVFSWLHRGADLSAMTDLSRDLRRRLADLATAGTLQQTSRDEAPDGAVKYGFRTADGHPVETVLIPHKTRSTLCLSSQIGCAFGCAFCATGRNGLVRSLRPGEIVEQAVRVQERCRARIGNVVFMGMGEPLANYEAVLQAVRLLNCEGGLQIGARHIAISTCGLPDQIRRLAGEGLQVALAISLHGATDTVREQLVPLNRKHPIAELVSAARFFAEHTGRKVVFQYVVIPGLNDTPDQSRRLSQLLRGLSCMVNLIPQNPVDNTARLDSAPAHRFAHLLREAGLEVAVRRSRGGHVLGACGQLAAAERGQKKTGRGSLTRSVDSA